MKNFPTISLIMNSSNKQWSFGIISNDIIVDDVVTNENLSTIIDTIKQQKIDSDNYEIIIVGSNSKNKDFELGNIKFINFDETIKDKWITKKKNIIIEKSCFENIIIIHDYVVFDPKWYEGFLNFDPDWDVSMCKIFNKDGTRWRDWILWWCGSAPYILEHNNTLLAPNRLLYDDYSYINSDMYINGTVIIGKKTFLMENKLDENLAWGQGEDCEWSARCRGKWNYKMNINSKLRLLKQHDNT